MKKQNTTIQFNILYDKKQQKNYHYYIALIIFVFMLHFYTNPKLLESFKANGYEPQLEFLASENDRHISMEHKAAFFAHFNNVENYNTFVENYKNKNFKAPDDSIRIKGDREYCSAFIYSQADLYQLKGEVLENKQNRILGRLQLKHATIKYVKSQYEAEGDVLDPSDTMVEYVIDEHFRGLTKIPDGFKISENNMWSFEKDHDCPPKFEELEIQVLPFCLAFELSKEDLENASLADRYYLFKFRVPNSVKIHLPTSFDSAIQNKFWRPGGKTFPREDCPNKIHCQSSSKRCEGLYEYIHEPLTFSTLVFN